MSQQPRVFRVVYSIYRDVLVRKYKDQHFWILSTFIPTFVIARMLVRVDPRIFLTVGGNHVHHFAYGFVILAVAGYLAVIRSSHSPPWLAALFGVGLGLSVDEAGMWLHLTDQYYNETSENAIIVVFALLVNAVYFREFWFGLIGAAFRWLKSLAGV